MREHRRFSPPRYTHRAQPRPCSPVPQLEHSVLYGLQTEQV